ncbi:MAG: hypothetical protein MJ252_05285 [archaeon]|nr:hypothetical protein [archaeon]
MIELTPPRKMPLKPMERLEVTNIERKKEIEATLRKKRERSRQLKEVKNKSEEQPIAKNTLKETNEVNSDDNIENVCVICGWVFPIGINKKYIKYHLNQCLDGNGQKSKEEILTSMKMDKLCKGPIKVDGPTCPICGKRFKTKNSKAKVNHVTDCQKNFQENDFAATHKRTSRIDFEYDI